jgi:hypothetical protein
MKDVWGVEVHLHTFLTLALGEGDQTFFQKSHFHQYCTLQEHTAYVLLLITHDFVP